MVALSLVLLLAGRPRRPHASPLPLQGDGVESTASARDAEGRLLFVNFRTVEPGVLYRGAAFPRNARKEREGGAVDVPAAWLGQEAFDFLRSRNVATVVTLLEDEQDFFAEEGYFRFWSERTGYRI